MSRKAFLIVRAEVADPADRTRFDEWYRREHLPDALAALRPDQAWRCWSTSNASRHYAFYEFPDVQTAEAAVVSAAMKELVVKFDEAWGARVTRSRDLLEQVQQPSEPS